MALIAYLLYVHYPTFKRKWDTNKELKETRKMVDEYHDSVQYSLNIDDSIWLDERYANGFGEPFEVDGKVLAVSKDRSALVVHKEGYGDNRLALHDSLTGNLIKDFGSSYLYRMQEAISPFLLKDQIPFIEETEQGYNLLYLDLESLEIKPIFAMIKKDNIINLRNLQFLSYTDNNNFVIYHQYENIEGLIFSAITGFVDGAQAWTMSYVPQEDPYKPYEKRYFIFLYGYYSAVNNKDLSITIYDSKTGEIVLENMVLYGDIVWLEDGFANTETIGDFESALTFLTDDQTPKTFEYKSQVYDFQGNLLGEFDGNPNIPFSQAKSFMAVQSKHQMFLMKITEKLQQKI